MIKVVHLCKSFKGLKAVNDVSFEAAEGKITGLIGSNGAGKTTVFNMLTGVYAPTGGKISYLGQDINGLKPYAIT
ncbi:MAG: ATP-binding cassette domain-containing protein, partial [Oscillospiraceae bacterium]